MFIRQTKLFRQCNVGCTRVLRVLLLSLLLFTVQTMATDEMNEAPHAVTVWTELRVDENLPTTNPAPIWLVGFGADTSAEPSGLGLLWQYDTVGWFPTWSLRLVSDQGLIESPSGGAPRQTIELLTEGPQRGHDYVAAISYDTEQGNVAVMVTDVTAGHRVISESMKLLPFHGALHPVEPVGEHAHGRIVRVEEAYTPVHIRWAAGIYEAATFSVRDVLQSGEQAAIRVTAPGDALPGTLRFYVQMGDQRQLLSELVQAADTMMIPLDLPSLPVGELTLIMQYIDAGLTLMEEQLPLSHGMATMRLLQWAADGNTGEFRGTYEISTDVTIPDAPFKLQAEVTKKHWDTTTMQYEPVSRDVLPLVDQHVTLSPGSNVVQFSGRVPAAGDQSLLQFNFVPSLGYPIHTTIQKDERMLALGVNECRLDVMSFNVRVPAAADGPNNWEHRKEYVLDVIWDFAPDVVGFQEPVPVQVDYLKRNLAGYEGVAVLNDPVGVHNALFHRTDTLERLHWGTFWLSDTPGRQSKTWGNNEARTVIWARYRVRATGQEFYVLNTHFHHIDPTGRLGDLSARLILDQIGHIVGDLPVVLMGDFNAKPSSVPYTLLVANDDAMFIDTWEEAPLRRGPVGTFHGFTGYSGDNRIDWILVTPQHFQILEMEHIAERRGHLFPSDHYPIQAALCFQSTF